MSLITETGSAASDSESYASVAFADAYLAARGNTLWVELTGAEKEQALRRATEYMCATYRARWHGQRTSSVQALDWPRIGVSADGYSVPSTTVPGDVANACAALAFKAAGGDLLADTERAMTREKIGPLETEWDKGSSQNKKYPAIDRMLSPYLGGGASMMLVRA